MEKKYVFKFFKSPKYIMGRETEKSSGAVWEN